MLSTETWQRFRDTDRAAGFLLESFAGTDEPDSVLQSVDEPVMIVYFDSRNRRLTVSRDPMGLGAVFVTVEDGSLYWSSSLSDLRRVTPRSEVNRAAVDFFISSGFTPAPWTFTRSHRKLAPGELALWQAGSTSFHRYAPLDPGPQVHANETRDVLFERRLPGVVSGYIHDPSRTGVLLSSGVDSALILAIATRELGAAPSSFTFEYGEYAGRLNEVVPAKEVAALFGSKHVTLKVDPSHLPSQIEPLIETFGDPFSYGIHSVMLADVDESGVRDLLSGAVAEYLEGQEFDALRLASMGRAAQGTLRLGSTALSGVLRSWTRKTAGAAFPLEGKIRALDGAIWTSRTAIGGNSSEHLFPPELRALIYPDRNVLAALQKERVDLLATELSRVENLSPLRRMVALHHRLFTAEHLHNWNYHAGRAHDSTIRAPMGNREFFLESLTYALEPKGKPALRRYAAQLLPEEVAYAPKTGQSVPINEWLRGPLSMWLLDVLDPHNVKATGLFEADGVSRLVNAHMSGKANLGWPLWNLASTHVWYDIESRSAHVRSG